MTLSGAVIRIDAGRTGLVWQVGDDGRLHQIAFGPAATGRSAELPVLLYPLAYPTFGEEPLREGALRVTHADGATSTRLRVTRIDDSADAATGSDESGSGPGEGDGTKEGAGRTVRVHMEDHVAPLEVVLSVRAHPEVDLIEQWVEVTNRADAAVTVHRAQPSAPSFAGADPHLTSWGGGWAAEWTESTRPLDPGVRSVSSAGGVRPSLHMPPVVLFHPDGPAGEEDGQVALATVVWGGDVAVDAEATVHGQQRILVGQSFEGAERHLDPGETFESAHVLWCWSEAGTGPTSRSLHRHVRSSAVRDGDRLRATVANTWEAVGFRLDPAGLTAQIERAAAVGAELFLLDDGWFGATYPRDDDTVGLGDWSVDRSKLPDGLQPLIDATLQAGMRFGLWVEPEMVNPVSELYEAHPDWVIAEPGRERRLERNQLVLDLCLPEVREFVVGVIDEVLSRHEGISYLKWDANRDITEPGSAALAPDRQSHLPIDRIHATSEVMAEVARRHPDVELMLCASGGGRSDLATLTHFHELWTSDNTDPVDRLSIQWGASHLLPAKALGAHVTHWGMKPVPFGCAVAMSARFGFDLDLTGLSPEDLEACEQAAERYSRIRDLVQHGDLHRLVSPHGTDRCALAYRDPEGEASVVFAYRFDDQPQMRGRRARPGRADRAGVRVPWLSGRQTGTQLAPGGPVEDVDITDGIVPWPERGPLSASVVLFDR